MKRILLVTMTLLPVFAADIRPQDEPQIRHEQARQLMRQKLTYSQGFMEGLVLQKYDLVATNAFLLRSMSLTNTFSILGNTQYKAAISNFQDSVDGLAAAARKQELWPAYEEYNRVAQSCVRCHQVFRHEQYLRSVQSDSK